MLKCSCFCKQSTIEHRYLEPVYVEILINRRKNQIPSYCRLSLMWSRYLEYLDIFISINLLVSRFFEILEHKITEIPIYWLKIDCILRHRHMNRLSTNKPKKR